MTRSAVLIWGLLGLLAAALAGCGPSSQSTTERAVWPQWRGPNGDGVLTEGPLPVKWSAEGENVRWQIDLPARGASQPIASGGRLYVTGWRGPGSGPVARIVIAIDEATGEVLWDREVFERRREKKHHRFGSYATPTPVTDGERIWVYFGGTLAALSRDGEILWTVETDPDYWSSSRYGAASSPVLTADAVIVFADDEWGREKTRSWLAAYDRETGEELWRSVWEDTCCSYATPLLRTDGGRNELVIATTPLLLGIDLATGDRLWQAGLSNNQVVPSLVAIDDLLIQTGSVHKKSNVAYRLAGAGADTQVEQIWQKVQSAPEMASSVIYDGLLFMVTDKGVLSCIEPETGKRVWRHRLPGTNFRASIVAGDGKLYLMTMGAATQVVTAGREFELLATNKLDELTESSPAVSENCLVIRTRGRLYCIDRFAAG